MVRILIIVALLASLFYTVQNWQPTPEVTADKVVTNRTVAPAVEAADEKPSGFYPTVPEVLPNVEKGYIFSEKRKIEKEPPPGELKPAVVEPGPEVLDSVAYTGSLIVGETRRALITFQEPTHEEGGANRKPAAPRRPAVAVAGAPAAGTQNKQLTPGDRFLGFAVTLIEPGRIVFTKGDLKVEKFLYDRNKKRLAAVTGRSETPPAVPGGVPPEAFAPPEMTPPATTMPAPGATNQSNRMVRRSQRLSNVDTGIRMPVMPVPGRPTPNN